MGEGASAPSPIARQCRGATVRLRLVAWRQALISLDNHDVPLRSLVLCIMLCSAACLRVCRCVCAASQTTLNPTGRLQEAPQPGRAAPHFWHTCAA